MEDLFNKVEEAGTAIYSIPSIPSGLRFKDACKLTSRLSAMKGRLELILRELAMAEAIAATKEGKQ